MHRLIIKNKISNIILFSIMLFPISSSNGLSINYLFSLYPIIYLILYKKIELPNKLVLRIFFIFLLIFCIGFPFVPFLFPGFTLRSFSSFLIFISIFSLSFLPRNKLDIISFKLSIVIISIFFSIQSLVSFFIYRDIGVFDLKGEIGSQRFGFVYLLAIAILVFTEDIFLKYVYLKRLSILIIFLGILLTFSRTPIIALVLTIVSFFIFNFNLKILISWKFLKKIIVFISIVSIFYSIIYFYFFDLLTFFDNRIVVNLINNENISDDIANSDTSEGTRIFIWNSIFNFTLLHPFTGSSYLGAFIMEARSIDIFNQGKYFMDSSHNQYMDTMLRTGFVGFLAYLILVIKISISFYKNDKSFFYGFLSIIIYGFFHETFKLSQGAFIFSFLISVYSKGFKGTITGE
jgi:O-antigen ligase